MFDAEAGNASAVDHPAGWPPGPPCPALSEGQAHGWLAVLDVPDAIVERLRPALSPDEAAKADRFHDAVDRQRFVVGRGVLREILGRYVGVPAVDVRLRYDQHGKPALAAGDSSLCFNLSHSAGMGLIAVGAGRRVGVDLERIREFDEAAKRFLSVRESQALQALPAATRPAAACHCWVRKEAYLKARGDGLEIDPRQIEVSMDPGGPGRLIGVSGKSSEAARWSYAQLPLITGYAAALVVEGSTPQLTAWSWSPI